MMMMIHHLQNQVVENWNRAPFSMAEMRVWGQLKESPTQSTTSIRDWTVLTQAYDLFMLKGTSTSAGWSILVILDLQEVEKCQTSRILRDKRKPRNKKVTP